MGVMEANKWMVEQYLMEVKHKHKYRHNTSQLRMAHNI